MSYPEEIEKTALSLAESNEPLSELRERLAAMEAIIIQEIASEKTPEGKPQFTNEALRAAELTIRMRDDADAVELKAQIAKGEAQKQQHLARLERLRGEFKIALLDRQAEIVASSQPLVM